MALAQEPKFEATSRSHRSYTEHAAVPLWCATLVTSQFLCLHTPRRSPLARASFVCSNELAIRLPVCRERPDGGQKIQGFRLDLREIFIRNRCQLWGVSVEMSISAEKRLADVVP